MLFTAPLCLNPMLSGSGLVSNALTPLSPDLYYGGEAFSVEQPQAFTCPYCGRMGYTEMSLQEHVAADHTETSTEVVRCCPSQTLVFSGVCPDSQVCSLLSTLLDLPHMCSAARRRPQPRDR